MVKVDRLEEIVEFKDWWMRNRIIKPPFNENLLHIDSCYTTSTLFTDGQYQVQLISGKPNSRSAQHIHPNVDSIEVYLGGHIQLIKNGIELLSYSDALERVDGASSGLGRDIRVLPTDWHGGTSGRFGSMFLSIQFWLNGVKPTSIHKDVLYLNPEEQGMLGVPLEENAYLT